MASGTNFGRGRGSLTFTPVPRSDRDRPGFLLAPDSSTPKPSFDEFVTEGDTTNGRPHSSSGSTILWQVLRRKLGSP